MRTRPSASHNELNLLPWGRMSEREKMVWASNYARNSLAPREAAVSADRAVALLRELAIDDYGIIQPEYDAARSCPGLSYEEFRSWYPTAFKISVPNASSQIDEKEIKDAFDRYHQSACDFY
ncbi:hypothetical protein [Lysobacter capsici]|uniref:hypothetical protein n=1 Tax=Lysobacter capsici TaxID=435897 RepID=UPI00128DC5CD|nr:hypothetical protein [Lysobacter capsici]